MRAGMGYEGSVESKGHDPGRTRWGFAALLIGAGLVAAFQVGKAAVALPQLRRDLDLDLSAAFWIVGAYGSVGAVAGLSAGALVGRIGARNALSLGLMAGAARGARGGLSQ